jgi:hypothetical protein
MAIEATTELYLASKKTLEKECWKAWRKNPIIEFNDYFSYAEEIFMDATRTFDPSHGAKFNSWLTTQLLRLKGYAVTFKITVNKKTGSENLVLDLNKKTEFLEGKPCALQDLKQPFNDVYSDSLSTPTWAVNWWDRLDSFKPYMGELTEDAKLMVVDILDGEASKKDETGKPIPERGNLFYSKLSPKQLYIRLYRRKGWTLDRVISARKSVENMLVKHSPQLKQLASTSEEKIIQEELF